MTSKIFISYRRQDNGGAAGRLYDFLETKIGSASLFKDVDTLTYGRDFLEEIRRAIDDSRIVLVVIGQNFITEEKRLFQDNDYVRYEIAYALERGRTVIPVRVNEARMPARGELPEEISKLRMLHGPELRYGSWKGDCQHFWNKIEPLFKKAVPRYSTAEGTSKISPYEFKDPRDGQTYKTVKLNGLVWMAENLNFSLSGGCWFFDDDPKDGAQYGRLYTWEVAKKACPPGWRLPTDEEWQELAIHFGGYSDCTGKQNIGDPREAYQALIEGGSSGFHAQLGGLRYSYGGFYSLDYWGGYWSATERDVGNAWYYYFDRGNGGLYRHYYNKSVGRSCRCVQGS